MLNKKGFWNLVIGICLVIGIWSLGCTTLAQAEEYDGIWFLGFNLEQQPFSNQQVRQAVNQVIKKGKIITEIISAETVPMSIIPPGMLGYDPDLTPNLYDVGEAKKTMKEAGFPMNDQRLKSLTLLHTDGLLTVKIAKEIKNNLRNIGMKIELVELSYMEQDKWVKGLTSGKYDLFLMGYKADYQKLFTSEATAQEDSYKLVEPLFQSDGDVNFTSYSNKKVDKLLNQLTGLDIALKSERHSKLKNINQILYEDLPVVVLFYIEKL